MAEGSSSLSGIRLFLPSLQNILAAAGRGSRPPTSPCTIQPILQLNVDLPILSPPTPSLAETAECVIGAGWTARTTDGGTGAASENEWRRADGREREMEGRPAGHCGHLELRVSLPARRVRVPAVAHLASARSESNQPFCPRSLVKHRQYGRDATAQDPGPGLGMARAVTPRGLVDARPAVHARQPSRSVPSPRHLGCHLTRHAEHLCSQGPGPSMCPRLLVADRFAAAFPVWSALLHRAGPGVRGFGRSNFRRLQSGGGRQLVRRVGWAR